MKYRIYENNFSLQEINDYLKTHYKSVLCQEIFSEGVRPASSYEIWQAEMQENN